MLKVCGSIFRKLLRYVGYTENQKTRVLVPGGGMRR